MQKNHMKKHILVIDDDQGISEVIKIVLTDGGYNVNVMTEGLGIEKMVEKLQPNLILLDIWMSGIDGRDVIQTLRKNKKTRNIPIVVISALSNTDKIATEAGAEDFLPKPFDIEDLLAIARKYTS